MLGRQPPISAAAWRRFARDGFHQTSMRDILAESGLSAGTVYRYFSGKHELITTIALQAATELRGTPADLQAAEPPPSLLEAAGRTVARSTDRSSTSLSTTPYASPNSRTVAVPAQ